MAIPTLKAIEDCGDFSKTVEPFIPQLWQLPAKVWENGSSGSELLGLYRSSNPLITGFALSVVVAAAALLVSEINRNYSQIDRMWSLLPTVYIAHFSAWCHLNRLPSGRVDVVLLCSAIWSARLTFNYWRKGGYAVGSEDYRWEIVRGQVPPALFFILNVTFISFIQSVLLILLSAPTYAILLSSQHEAHVTVADMAFATIYLGLVISEFVSDQQQWGESDRTVGHLSLGLVSYGQADYQTAKKTYQESGRVPQGFSQADLDRGFITSGLWAYCRHPNFAAEQSIWLVLYQWSCYSSRVLYSWTGLGSLLLVLLFQSSTWLTELITSRKYAEYGQYQKQVGMFIPTLTPYETRHEVAKQEEKAKIT